MAYQPNQPQAKFDIRQYIGLFVFYWRFMTFCILFCLAGAALYIQYVPPVYQASGSLMVARDPHLELGGRAHSPLQHFGAHAFLLNSDTLKERAASRLADEWASQVRQWRGGMIPEVSARRGRGLRSTIDISARGSHPDYLVAFLKVLIEEHEKEWRALQSEASGNAVEVLVNELGAIEDKIARAEEELIEFQRLHDIARIEAIGAHESRQLSSLISRRGQLSTEIMLLESQYPFLQDVDLGVLDQVDTMTRETAMLALMGGDETDEDFDLAPMVAGLHPLVESNIRQREESAAAMRGWQELRVQLTRLQETERELAANFTTDHPRRIEIRRQIESLRERLDTETRVRMQRLLDRRDAMEIQLNALEGAEQSWQARNLLASRRKSELNRLAGVLRRFEANYNTLYSRLHDLRVSSELNTESFRIVRPVGAEEKPVWPDPLKIMALALALALGGGVGITLLLDFFGNRVQFPRDIEQELGQTFLGGIPYWAHSNLETMVRPTVIENHNAAATEAYRTLRSTLLSAMDKLGNNAVIIASADSREGKTLTALNTAILTAKLGKRVLLLDMDLRRGRLHRSLDLKKSPGISDVLQHGRSMHDVIVPTRFENLYVAPAGDPIENAAEMLHGVGMATLLDPLRNDYDYIFIDSPPVLRAAEAMIMCNEGVTGVVFVTRVNRTSKPLIRYALKMIKDANMLGVIVNYIELHRISSLYYVYQYPNASYSYYEYGRYGDKEIANPVARRLAHIRHRAMRYIRRKLMS